ncbi:TetR family transcriptional regulator [Peribacillus sp. SI8-4]|uniref:TetR/AcrR family transcriptional regulator n=1 Tax=Peribacillus sp. SI8-4 TaxID=3048009 RepID=UPI0025537851|nr:TetR family transcriptional regulator [Peribacillus sp. SI8-4]
MVKDIRHITSKEIAALANVSRGALYFYYEDKFAIFEEIVQEQKEGLQNAIFDSLKDLDHIDLREMNLKVLPALSYVAKHTPFFLTMMDRNKMPYVNFHAFFFEVFNREIMLTPMKENVSESLKDLYVHYRALYTYAIILYWFKEGMEPTPEKISRQFWDLVSQKRYYWIFGVPVLPEEKEARIDRRVIRTRQALQEAMIQLIIEKKDYSAVTISDITRRSDMRRATFYDHYSGKADLLKAITHQFCTDIIAILTLEGSTEEVTMKQSEAILVQLFAYLSEHTSIVHFISGNYGIPDPIPEILNRLSQFFLKQRINIHAGKQMYAYYVSGLLVGLILYRLHEGKEFTPQFLAQEFIQFLDLKKYKINLL